MGELIRKYKVLKSNDQNKPLISGLIEHNILIKNRLKMNHSWVNRSEYTSFGIN